MKSSQITITYIIIFLTLALVTLQTQGTTERPPEPTPSPEFKCPNREDNYHPHPTKCTSYYYCTNGLAWLIKCADPLYFNAKISQCDWEWNVECTPVETSSDYKVKGTIIIGPDPDYKCDPDVNGAFPHETDCDKFYDCWNGNASRGICTEDMLFDLTYAGCNWPELTHCQDRSRPPGIPTPNPTTTRKPGVTGNPEFQCPKPNGLFEDPTDCSSYYHCSGGVAWHQVCSPSLFFRQDLETCDFSANVDCGTRPIPTNK